MKFKTISLVLAVAFFASVQIYASEATYPLDPLTAQEIEQAVTIVKKSGKVPEGSLFSSVSLKEPAKEAVLAYKDGQKFDRKVFAVVFDREHSKTFETIVDLNKNSVESAKFIEGVQPSISTEELTLVPKIVRANKDWQAAILKRGLKDFDAIMIDPWAPGTLSKDESTSIRWIRALSYIKGENKNGYARPIEGIVVVVNMNEKKVEHVYDYGVHPLPPNPSDLDEKATGPQRTGVKPLIISQPQGPSFEVNGHEVKWQKWHFRFGMQPREGLVLYQVGYEDKGRVRPILYKASLAEMVVPYGSPDKAWTFRNAFDEGEYGIGRLVDAMEPGRDAPEYATFFDADFADDFGKPFAVSKAIALYERDGFLLWKHYEFYADSNESRRGRELVLSSIVTVGNYDYGFNWIFRQDGSLEMQAMATGIMLAKGVDIKNQSELTHNHHGNNHWHLVAPYVAAPHHQHFFNFRLDFDVDGPKNKVSELNVRSLPPSSENPAANAFAMDETLFSTEKEAQREVKMETTRKWIVSSSTEKNALGQSTGYALIPGDTSIPYISKQSKVRQRAGFIDHHLWVTPYNEAEMYAADKYPNQSKGGEGLPTWTKQNRSIKDRDIVLWYTFGLTHTPRPEEWPVMSTTTLGFKLLPVSFFSSNPALDVPKIQ